MKTLVLTDNPDSMGDGAVYCGNDMVAVTTAHDHGKYLFDCLDGEDYLAINNAAYATAKHWDQGISLELLWHDGHNFARIVENLLFGEILRGITEKIAVLIKLFDDNNPQAVVVDLKSAVFATAAEIVAKEKGIPCRIVSPGTLVIHKGGRMLREFGGRYLLPRLMRVTQPVLKRLNRPHLLFAYSQNHFRALLSLVDDSSSSTLIVGSMVGTNLKSFDSGKRTEFCIDSLITWKIWKMYGRSRKAIRELLTETSVVEALRTRFTYAGISYFDAIHNDIICFMSSYIPNAIRYYEISARLFILCNPDSLVFGNDTCHRARAAITAGRKVAIPSFVIQHGIIASKEFYFPYADHMAVWGEHSREIMEENGIDPSRVHITGTSVFHRPNVLPVRTSPNSRITLISSPSPSGFSRSSIGDYIDIIRGLMTRQPDFDITVKVHPFENGENYLRVFRSLGMNLKVVENCDLDTLISSSAVVITSYSTVAIQSVLLGTPVVCFSSVFPEDTRLNEAKVLFHAIGPDDASRITEEIIAGRIDSRISCEGREDFLGRYAAITGEEAEVKQRALVDGFASEVRHEYA